MSALNNLDRIAPMLPDVIAAARAAGVSSITELTRRVGESVEAVTAAVSARVGVRCLDAETLDVATADWQQLSPQEARQRRVLQVRIDGAPVAALIDDPWNDELLGWLTEKLGRRPPLLLTTPPLMKKKLDDEIRRLADQESDQRRVVAKRAGESAGAASQPGRPGGAVHFVQQAVESAWSVHASDVHFEATRDGLLLKFRLDGLLIEQEQLADSGLAAEIVSRIKVMAELDIAEKRVPQDGRFSIELGARLVDCRVSVMPSAHGEDAVIRILDKRHLASSGAALTLVSLGFDDAARARLRSLASLPHGMLLVTGPTGSGKTTTLYALLSEIRTGTEKIVTIEDPIEYDVQGVLQVPVNEKKGLTFARGLRSILRHDPDIIMVGEIRDRETADIAIQSALTGHLVFTTVHANTAFDVVSRFTHMGVDLYGFVSSLNGVLAQRLVRLNCPQCTAADASQLESLAAWSHETAPLANATPTRGTGCAHCRGTGYLGRTAVGEVLHLDDRLRDLLVSRAPLLEVKQHVEAQGARSLRQAAALLVATGRTTLDEVQRVVG